MRRAAAAAAAVGPFPFLVPELIVSQVDVVGTIVLFQALCGLMRRSARPRFVTLVASGAGCLAGGTSKEPAAPDAHGASKAALNWATRKMHFENEWLGTSRPCFRKL